ncbi:MAG: FAD-dependent oxidoreductase [Casimicrobiaceae bacterium]
MTADYDVFVIGAGQAGPPLARALVHAGRRVALAERKHLGGSCVNFGCTPTKAAFASARVAHVARRAGEYGIRIASVGVDSARCSNARKASSRTPWRTSIASSRTHVARR